jgi:hypothetical protein
MPSDRFIIIADEIERNVQQMRPDLAVITVGHSSVEGWTLYTTGNPPDGPYRSARHLIEIVCANCRLGTPGHIAIY